MNEEIGQDEEVRRQRQEYIGRSFWRAQRASAALVVRKLTAQGHTGLRAVHTTLIATLDAQGTRITTVAKRMGITKQAAGHLVNDLVEKGYLICSRDPTDLRAVLVTFTEMGRRFLVDSSALKDEIEAEFTALVGEERFEQVRETLDDLLTHIEEEKDE